MEKEIPTLKGKYDRATGRRKEAIARVRLYPGTGRILINQKEASDYFNNKNFEADMIAPFKLLGLEKKLDVSVVVSGGGIKGQVSAIVHGISRALVKYNEDLKTTLRRSGYLTRDPRVKERKKYGLKRARKAPQFSKR